MACGTLDRARESDQSRLHGAYANLFRHARSTAGGCRRGLRGSGQQGFLGGEQDGHDEQDGPVQRRVGRARPLGASEQLHPVVRLAGLIYNPPSIVHRSSRRLLRACQHEPGQNPRKFRLPARSRGAVQRLQTLMVLDHGAWRCSHPASGYEKLPSCRSGHCFPEPMLMRDVQTSTVPRTHTFPRTTCVLPSAKTTTYSNWRNRD